MPELIGFDTETYLITPGNLAPRMVCGSFYDGREGWLERTQEALDSLHGLFRPGVMLAVANGAYDWAVTARHRPAYLREIFDLYERGQVFDIQIVASLDAIADGRMTEGMVLNRNGQPLRAFGDTGRVVSRFSLANCVWLYLNRLDAKANDEFRTSYGELDELPTEQWPETARLYPVDDARNTYEVAAVQLGKTNAPAAYNIGKIGHQFDAPPLLDVTWPTFQGRAAFAMHLGSVWGFRTNEERIQKIEAKVNKTFEEDNKKFTEWGFLKPNGKENRPAIKRAVALAYGSTGAPCFKCMGAGKVLSEKSGNPVNCKTCDSTGLLIADSVPRTPADGIATDRDTLDGTGDPKLEAWAEASKNDKMRETYLPWLKTGITHPINVRSNPLVASGRCSYDGLVQLIPPIARECIEARTTITYHEVPEDYVLQEGESWE